MSAKLVQLIETELERRGAGTAADPVRVVRQWWTTGGELVVEAPDRTEQEQTMVKFQCYVDEAADLKRKLAEAVADGQKSEREADALLAECNRLEARLAEAEKNRGVRLPKKGDVYALADKKTDEFTVGDGFKVGASYKCAGVATCSRTPKTPAELGNANFWAEAGEPAAVLDDGTGCYWCVPLRWLQLAEAAKP